MDAVCSIKVVVERRVTLAHEPLLGSDVLQKDDERAR